MMNEKSFSIWIEDYVSVWNCYPKFDGVRYNRIQGPSEMKFVKKMLALGCHKVHLSPPLDTPKARRRRRSKGNGSSMDRNG